MRDGLIGVNPHSPNVRRWEINGAPDKNLVEAVASFRI